MTRLGARLWRINRQALLAAVSVVKLIVFATSLVLGLRTVIDTSRVQARVPVQNFAAPLAFQDPKSARELPQSLRNSPDVLAASLFTADGVLFARFLREGAKTLSLCWRELETLARDGGMQDVRAALERARLAHASAVAKLREPLLEFA